MEIGKKAGPPHVERLAEEKMTAKLKTKLQPINMYTMRKWKYVAVEGDHAEHFRSDQLYLMDGGDKIGVRISKEKLNEETKEVFKDGDLWHSILLCLALRRPFIYL